MRPFTAACLLLVILLSSACNLQPPESIAPVSSATLGAIIGATSTSTPQPEPTATVTPSPTPTPLPEVRIEAGDNQLWLGDYDAAAREYQAVLAASPDADLAAAAQLGLGRIALLQERYNDALDAFRQAIALAPDTVTGARAHYYQGECLSAIDRFGEAAAEFSSYLSSRPGQIDSYVNELRGDALAASGDYSGALTAYQAAEQSPRLADLSPLQLKIARTLYATSDFASAVTVYQTVYASTASDVTRAEADYGMGSAQIALGQYELAYAQFQDAVNNYPAAYASYQALVELVDAGVTVDELSRGLVDYFAGQYVPAINALDRYLAAGGEDSGTALHYKALILRELGDPASALIVWQQLIDTIPGHRFWPDAWEEKAYTLWAYQDDPVSAAAAMLTFADQNPAHDRAADFLFQAGRYLERAGSLAEAAAAWDRVVDGYPASENAYRSLFLAGISRYRLGDKAAARNTFQRGLLLSEDSINLSASYYWIGKIQEEEGDVAAAENSWQQAVTRDPTGYYSERARDRLLKRDSFTSPEFIDYGFDLILEKQDADAWMRTTFNLPPETNLDGLGGLESDGRIIRGQEFWALGLYNEARSEFESLRNEVSEDPAATYRLAGYFNAIGLYRSAITASRQVLSLARLDDAGTLTAPAYFNHIRFAPNFRQLVFQAAEEESLTPLFIFSLMRQESLFEGFVVSSAGARGLMQIMPETGQQVAANMGWPAGFTPSDLYRPTVSIRLGTHYLARQLVAFDGDFYRALAAYNGGPGNAMAWSDLAGNDQDLFLEVIRIQESRDYLMRIFEIFSIYRRIYGRTP